MDPQLLTVSQAAQVAGISRTRAYELIKTRQWPVVRLGRSTRVPRNWLISWVDELTQQATADMTGS